LSGNGGSILNDQYNENDPYDPSDPFDRFLHRVPPPPRFPFEELNPNEPETKTPYPGINVPNQGPSLPDPQTEPSKIFPPPSGAPFGWPKGWPWPYDPKPDQTPPEHNPTDDPNGPGKNNGPGSGGATIPLTNGNKFHGNAGKGSIGGSIEIPIGPGKRPKEHKPWSILHPFG
jgi:hypothetical protein